MSISIFYSRGRKDVGRNGNSLALAAERSKGDERVSWLRCEVIFPSRLDVLLGIRAFEDPE